MRRIGSSQTVHRRMSRTGLALAVILAGAGLTAMGDDGDDEVATGGAQFSTADEETAKLGSDAEPGEFPRTIVHSMGETELTERPERVVVLDGGELDDVVSLGVTPVGIAYAEGSPQAPAYLPIDVSDVAEVGTINALNLEAIAALEPDLIIGSQLRAADLYPDLSEIAPTVFSIRPGFPWKENFLLVADALGLENQAVDILNDYQARATEVGDLVEGDPTISILRFMPDKIRLYGNLSFIGVVLDDSGLTRPENQDFDELAIEISTEQIDQADGDWVFYSSYGGADSTDEGEVVNGPLWGTLGAVADEQAIAVSDELWFLGLGPSGAMALLDELADILGAAGADT